MKITVISDITFDLMLKQVSKQNDFIIHKYVYADRIVSELMNIDSYLGETDVLIIYFDSYFYRYTDSYIAEILNNIKNISGRFSGNILVSNNLSNGRHNSILKTSLGQREQVILESESAINALLQTSNVYFFDVNKIFSFVGLKNAYNFKLGFLYQMPYTKEFINLLSSELTAFLHFIGGIEKKAILVDCDNTLWNGILGEDGIDGIKCDRNANGVLFYQFQEFLLEKKKEGFILGLCSKNNEPDVKEAFAKLNMPLEWDDFLVKKVNWLPKTENIRNAVGELNIGLDSIIFIDDNEFELQSVRSMIPQVNTLKLENDYEVFLHLTDNYLFKKKRLTKEDLVKSEQYAAEQERNKIRDSAQSIEEYLESLHIKFDVTINNSNDYARISQLTEKTNQFNFNKEIFSVKDIEQFVSKGNLIYGLRLSDKFGDYGLVGLILVEDLQKQVTIRNFLLSCRALGRRAEDNFLKYVVNDLDDRGLAVQEIKFKETHKNTPAREFYDNYKKSGIISHASN